jgi:cell division transport system permease protein
VKLGFFLKEALRAMRRNAVPSFAALATVLVTMLVMGIFIPVVQATTGAANDVRSRILVDVFMKTGASRTDVDRVREMLAQTPHVGSVQFVSKDQALRENQERFKDAFQLLGRNPLPDTFRVTPDRPDNALALREALETTGADGSATPRDSAIEKVSDRRTDTKKLLTVTSVVKWTMAVLAIVLGSASILLIANTIRLSLFARRREVEVMKLVGATDWFIRWPFILEGIVVGALGSALAIVLLGVGKLALLDRLADTFALFAAPKTIPFVILIAVIMAGGIAISAAGSGLSLRRFLRV